MPKGQQRSNKETRKPKKAQPGAPPVKPPFGLPASPVRKAGSRG